MFSVLDKILTFKFTQQSTIRTGGCVIANENAEKDERWLFGIAADWLRLANLKNKKKEIWNLFIHPKLGPANRCESLFVCWQPFDAEADSDLRTHTSKGLYLCPRHSWGLIQWTIETESRRSMARIESWNRNKVGDLQGWCREFVVVFLIKSSQSSPYWERRNQIVRSDQPIGIFVFEIHAELLIQLLHFSQRMAGAENYIMAKLQLISN